MEEKTSVPLEGTVREYAPSMSATVPVRVPFNTTDAAGIESPLEASETVPLTVMFCAKRAEATVRSINERKNLVFFIS